MNTAAKWIQQVANSKGRRQGVQTHNSCSTTDWVMLHYLHTKKVQKQRKWCKRIMDLQWKMKDNIKRGEQWSEFNEGKVMKRGRRSDWRIFNMPAHLSETAQEPPKVRQGCNCVKSFLRSCETWLERKMTRSFHRRSSTSLKMFGTSQVYYIILFVLVLTRCHRC